MFFNFYTHARKHQVSCTTTLRFFPEDAHATVVAVGASIVGCTLGVVAVDAAFRSTLTSQYVSAFTGLHPWLTTVLMISQATRDEILGRLILVGGMVTVAGFVLRGRTIPPAVLAAIFLVAQIFILLPQLPTPNSTVELTYDTFRYAAPGLLWGWLFWRHGFVGALLGHAGTHLVLDPALRRLLDPAF
jgi:hypothetical protein